MTEITWDAVTEWLKSDTPADCDILDNYPLAQRLAALLQGKTHSIGIVSPFGGGKSSIVNWMAEVLNSCKEPRVLISRHSCWGFETSSSAVHEMLADAVRIVGVDIDSFHVRSLPESYRETFSAGGEWFGAFSNLLLKIPDATQQFHRLSDLLRQLNARMVFVVEDLDRADTKGFEIQEVLGFLQRMREFDNFGFILTGGISSTRRIDFEKLCDHVELLKPVQPSQAGDMIRLFHNKWQNTGRFAYILKPGMGEETEWNPQTYVMVSDREKMSFPRAIVELLRTPRALRQALGRTNSSWQYLKGEVNLDHLIALNSLRTGAPEAFLFLVRYWDRFQSDRPRPDGKKDADDIRKGLQVEWSDLVQTVEWNETAATTIIRFLLPGFGDVLEGKSSFSTGSIQQLSVRRYWDRAVTERIDSEELRDQHVFAQMDDWLHTTSSNSPLIDSLCSSLEFGPLWLSLMRAYPNLDADQIRSLGGQVLNRVRMTLGANASIRSTGVWSVCQLANERLAFRPDNIPWLRAQIAESASISLQLVCDLWSHWGGGNGTLVSPDQRSIVRASIRSILQATGTAIVTRALTVDRPDSLSRLVFGEQNQGEVVDDWSWLGPMIAEAIRRREANVAESIIFLLNARMSGEEDFRSTEPIIDAHILHSFFGADAKEVIEILSSMTSSISADRRSLLNRVIAGAIQLLNSNAPPNQAI